MHVTSLKVYFLAAQQGEGCCTSVSPRCLKDLWYSPWQHREMTHAQLLYIQEIYSIQHLESNQVSNPACEYILKDMLTHTALFSCSTVRSRNHNMSGSFKPRVCWTSAASLE